MKQNLSENKCKVQDVIFDIKTIMQDYYFAQFIENGDELNLTFDNGQKFIIQVKECSN